MSDQRGTDPAEDGRSRTPRRRSPTPGGTTPSPRRHGPAATIADVAAEAGVSRAAVSKVIRDAYGVSPQMRSRVEAAIAQLGYRPRVAARSMRGSSYTFGLEIPQITNEFLSLVTLGAAEQLLGTAYQLVVAPAVVAAESAHALESLVDRQVDGLVTISRKASREWAERLALRTPVVMIGRHDISDHFDTVASDDARGAHLVMDHLFQLGHRRIAHLTLEEVRPESQRERVLDGQTTGREPHDIRQEVYLQRMKDRGLQPTVVYTTADELAAEADIAPVLRAASRPTAVFAGHDTLAIGVLRATATLGLGPADVSVVGYDDMTIASHPLISLTSVHQPGRQMGADAVRLLLERLAGRTEAVQIQADVSLRVRGSTAPPRDATDPHR